MADIRYRITVAHRYLHFDEYLLHILKQQERKSEIIPLGNPPPNFHALPKSIGAGLKNDAFYMVYLIYPNYSIYHILPYFKKIITILTEYFAYIIK